MALSSNPQCVNSLCRALIEEFYAWRAFRPNVASGVALHRLDGIVPQTSCMGGMQKAYWVGLA